MDDRIFKNLLLTNSLTFFIKSANFLFLFYNVFKEQMITNKIEDGREAPLKPSIWKNDYIFNIIDQTKVSRASLTEDPFKLRLQSL